MQATARNRKLGPGQEGRLLRLLCQDAAPEAQAVLALCPADFDWRRFFRLAAENRVLPYLQQRLSAVPKLSLPADIRDEQAELARSLRLHLLALTRDLLQLVELCEREHIAALPYKGPVLAALYYDDLSARQFRDIDLLVPRADVARARALLEREGWQPKEQLSAAQDEAWLERDCELHFARGEERALELHWHVLPAAHTQGLSAGQLWQNLVPLQLAGVWVRTFPPEEWLLLLCIHGGDKHRWSRLQMILDVAQLLRRHPDLAWPRVAELARATGRERSLQLGLFLAWHLLGAPLPREVLSHIIAEPRVLAKAALLSERPFVEEQLLPTYERWAETALEQRQQLRGLGLESGLHIGLARYLGATLEPEWRDRETFHLPPAWDFLYWGLRPARLLARHGLRLLRRIGLLNTE